MENREEFIKELSALSNKYKIKIGSCGCCDSPYLDSEEEFLKMNKDYQRVMADQYVFPGTYTHVNGLRLEWVSEAQ